jgi:hypothetical protein
MLPEVMRWAYTLGRVTGTWPIVRGLRLRWLDRLSRQLKITDMRQHELLLERYALERLP